MSIVSDFYECILFILSRPQPKATPTDTHLPYTPLFRSADNLLMWSHYGDGLRGFCIAFDEEAITRGDTTGYVLDVAYLDAPPHVDSFIYGVAWDQDWYSHVAIEETEKAIKYQGKKIGRAHV